MGDFQLHDHLESDSEESVGPSKKLKRSRPERDSDSQDSEGEEDQPHLKVARDHHSSKSPSEIIAYLKTAPIDEGIPLSLSELGEAFNELYARWTCVVEDDKIELWTDPISLACKRYGDTTVYTDNSDAANPIEYSVLALYEQRKLEESHIKRASDLESYVFCQLTLAFTVEDLLTGQDNLSQDVDLAAICGDSVELRIKIDRVGRAIASNMQLLMGFAATLRTHGSANDVGAPRIIDPNAYDIFDRNAKFLGYQELMIYILRQIRKRNLRRSKDRTMMETLRTRPLAHPETGEMTTFNTCSWVPLLNERNMPMTTMDFITENAPKQFKMDMWKHMTTSNNLDKLAKYLDVCKEEEFPTLNIGNTHISFNNGILELCTGRLLTYPVKNASIVSMNFIDQECPSDITLLDLYNCDVPYSKPSHYKHADVHKERQLRKESVGLTWSVIYGELDMIETPTLEGIFDMQLRLENSLFWNEAGIKEDQYIEEFSRLKFWHYALLGRLLFEVGDKDNWQVIQFFKGVAGSGKSTLCKLVSWFFRSEDVGYLSNQMRGGSAIGGLMDVYKCKVWMVTEVDSNFGLERTKFQSMVCGEVVTIDQLYSNTINWRWRSHGMLAGNKFFGYKDTSGSVTRRVLNTDFNKPIPESSKDPDMEKKLKKELSNIIYKSVLAYLYLTELYKGCDIWSIVPQYFSWTREKLSANCDPLGAFIKSSIGGGELMKFPDLKGGMLWSQLREMFMQSEFKKDLKPGDYKDIQASDMQQIGPLLLAMGLKLLQVTSRTKDQAEELLLNGGEGNLSKWSKEATNFYIVAGIAPNRSS